MAPGAAQGRQDVDAGGRRGARRRPSRKRRRPARSPAPGHVPQAARAEPSRSPIDRDRPGNRVHVARPAAETHRVDRTSVVAGSARPDRREASPRRGSSMGSGSSIGATGRGGSRSPTRSADRPAAVLTPNPAAGPPAHRPDGRSLTPTGLPSPPRAEGASSKAGLPSPPRRPVTRSAGNERHPSPKGGGRRNSSPARKGGGKDRRGKGGGQNASGRGRDRR